jgi:RiboL-PSP-HEPN
MPSEAQKSLDANLMEIDRLLELHTLVGGPAKGRRRGLEVLNKSAIVLITAYWEAYCEDIAAEALAHIVKHAKSSAVLPNELKKPRALPTVLLLPLASMPVCPAR